MDTYFTSDLHFSHKNLVRGTSKWDGSRRTRDFDTVEEHDQRLIDNINKIVKPDDILYVLGDFAMGGKDSILRARRSLNVKTLHLILGNHDDYIRDNCVLKAENGYTNAKRLFTTVDELKVKKINGQHMVLCHYGMRNWTKASKGAWNLFGHSHGFLDHYIGKDGKKFKTLDVGVDTHSEFRPYHFDELATIFSGDDYMNFNGDQHD